MTRAPVRIAVMGMGKIAHDQHLPAIAGSPDFILAATVSRSNSGVAGVPHYRSLQALFDDGGVSVDAVALCTPPQVRYDLATLALERGSHVFLEKPPGATMTEVAALERHAANRGLTLFVSWHSRFAAGVEPARAWLANRRIDRVTIVWREDVRVWHPQQAWIWEPGGLGVFDPGINALSIATQILPRPFFLRSGTLELPANRAAPIAAMLEFRDTAGAPIRLDLDWRQTGLQSWDITVETDAGICGLSHGGAMLTLPGGTRHYENCEYAGLYTRFGALISTGASDVDMRPLMLVADTFLAAARNIVEPFYE